MSRRAIRPRLPRWAIAISLGWGPALVAIGLASGGIGDRRLVVLLALSLVLSGLAYLAAASLGRHLAAAVAQAASPWVVRHRGLLFAAPMGSFTTGWLVHQRFAGTAELTPGEWVFFALSLATIMAPLALWAGGMWQRGFDAGMDVLSGRDDEERDR